VRMHMTVTGERLPSRQREGVRCPRERCPCEAALARGPASFEGQHWRGPAGFSRLQQASAGFSRLQQASAGFSRLQQASAVQQASAESSPRGERAHSTQQVGQSCSRHQWVVPAEGVGRSWGASTCTTTSPSTSCSGPARRTMDVIGCRHIGHWRGRLREQRTAHS